ncbi:putative protein N(5)-glutamine methyltransferase, partial [Streptomyces sp. GXMU-J5]|nr:putative protein N(5)-glutamine methyltransferase [Streptomyces beihaiensis]
MSDSPSARPSEFPFSAESSAGSSTESSVVAALRGAGCVFAEDEARVLLASARGPAELTAMVRRRSEGVPLEHVVGWAEFCGLRVDVD